MVRTTVGLMKYLALKVCLNPLKSGQWFGRENMLSCFPVESVSIPSSRGNGSDPTPSSSGKTLIIGLNPLKSGQWFGPDFCDLLISCQMESQSPQVGAMVRTKWRRLTLIWRTLVSIPSSRGNGSDKIFFRFSTVRVTRLNPLKSGQWFGRNYINGNIFKIISLNPLKSGQWFGPKL